MYARLLLLALLTASPVLLWAHPAQAQCVVKSGTQTYTDGEFLSAPECDTNGKVKTSGGGGGTQYNEDTAHNSGDTGTMALGVRRDANTTLADTTGDYAPFQLDANGNLKVNVIAGGGTGGVSIAEDAAHTPGENITPLGCRRIDTAATSAGTSGDWATLDCDANGRIRTVPLFVSPNGDTLVDDTNDAIRVTGVTVQAVSGNVAHDSAESQSPVVVGGHASSSVAGETIVTNGDAVRAHYGRDGVQQVRTGCALEDIVSAVVTATAGANTSGIAAQGAGVKVYLSQIIIYNNGASNGSMIVTDGSGGTTKLKLPFPASTGTTVNLALPIGFTANTAIFVDPTGSDNIDVTLIGCKSQL